MSSCQGRSESFPPRRSKRRPLRRREAPPGGGGEARPRSGFILLRERNRGGGKVGNLLLVFHFSTAFVAGAAGMWKSRRLLARFPRGSWEVWEACPWLSTLSTATAFPQLSSLGRLRGYLCSGARLWLAIAGRGPFSSCCSLVGSSPHSSPGYEHGGSSDPATPRSAALSPVPQSIRQTVDCW